MNTITTQHVTHNVTIRSSRRTIQQLTKQAHSVRNNKNKYIQIKRQKQQAQPHKHTQIHKQIYVYKYTHHQTTGNNSKQIHKSKQHSQTKTCSHIIDQQHNIEYTTALKGDANNNNHCNNYYNNNTTITKLNKKQHGKTSKHLHTHAKTHQQNKHKHKQ